MLEKIKNLFCRKKYLSNKEFSKMPKKEKKDFLSNDLNERIMRVEQRVSTRFGKFIHYKNTEYYKSLSDSQKKKFEKYLKNKKKKKLSIYISIFLGFLSIGFLNLNFTGNVARETLGDFQSSFLGYFVLGALFLLIVFLFLKKKRINYLNRHLKIIDNVFLR
jgi:magnesium-transporting ATPase (P-type)